MPRAGQVRPPVEERLSDRIALGVLTRVFPAELVDEVIAETGRGERRCRLLPARVVVYFVLAMCLFSGQGYEEVARLLACGLAWARRWRGRWEVPTTAAISRARVRLGPEPLKALFARVCRPVAGADTPGVWYRGWRVVAVDGTTLDVPDTPENAAFFGRPGSGRGEGRAAFPQVRLVVGAECGTRAVFAAAIGPCTVGETTLADTLWGHLQPGMLVLADRNSPRLRPVAGRGGHGGGPAVADQVRCGAAGARGAPWTARTARRSSPGGTSGSAIRRRCGSWGTPSPVTRRRARSG